MTDSVRDFEISIDSAFHFIKCLLVYVNIVNQLQDKKH